MRWSDFASGQAKSQMPRSMEVLSCSHCSSTWLYLVQVNQFSNQQVSVLQAPNGIHHNNIPLLVCAKCGRGVRHNITHFQMTKEQKLYNQMQEEILNEQAQQPITTTVTDAIETKNTIPEVQRVTNDDAWDKVSSDKPE